MILKSLLLQGFKSFPDKTEIRFTNGLTAIVGPNGSGKSNISDAIRWVLGEQSSKMLRGSKMEDVIFGGASNRSPLGFSEVSLVLDNSKNIFKSEHTEIMITRKYYRSGESDYYINKKSCRLKDIHELFMDTGLGKDGYSIIGQGKIDEILSLKSEERREIFEEAAGITKFRYRKEDAQKKLCATQENLIRIRDIYNELGLQIAPLEKQSQKAKEYLSLKEKLKEIEISIWFLELEELKKEKNKSIEKLDEYKKNLENTRSVLSNLYEQTELISQDIHKTDVYTDEFRKKLKQHEQESEKRNSYAAVLNANIENAIKNIERNKQEEKSRKEQANLILNQQQQKRENIIELEKSNNILSEKFNKTEKKNEQEIKLKCSLEAEIKEIKEKIEVLEAKKFQVSIKLTEQKTALSNMKDRTSNIDKEVEIVQDELLKEKQIQKAYNEKHEQCGKQLIKLKQLIYDKNILIKSLNKNIYYMKDEKSSLDIKLKDLDNKIKLIYDMQREFEGFSNAVKIIMKRAKNKIQMGIKGPVSSLISVESEYVIAVETALGAATSNIVVENIESAKQAINFLKQNDCGRATFLPIDTIKPTFLKDKDFFNISGCYGTADALVKCDDEYKNIIKSLLARTVVAKDLDCAAYISKKFENKFRIVTLDGQMIQAGGAITGGSISKTTGALSRADKLKKLEHERKEIKEKFENISEKLLNENKQLEQMQIELKNFESEKNSLESEKTKLEALKSQHKMILERANEKFLSLSLEKTDIVSAKSDYEENIEKNKYEFDRIEKDILKLSDIFNVKSKDLKIYENNIKNLQEKIIQYKTLIAKANAQIESEKSSILDLQAVVCEINQSIENIVQLYLGFEKQIEEYNKNILNIQNEIKNQKQLEIDLNDKINQQVKIRMNLELKKTTTEKQIQEKNEYLLLFERENAKINAENASIDEKRQNILNKMWEQYQLTPELAQDYCIQIKNLEQSKNDIKTYKEKISKLGNINLDAVEQYETLMERFTFLGEQKQDLEYSQNELNGVIKQLTDNMSKVFAKEFAKLNCYFSQTFKEIFGGGNAELKLENDKDILNCGIEIYVCLPGKTVKSMSLLSGGERAFVAISLYFAILKLKPTPFSVLDEIEAALDDVNVSRFAKYIKKLSDKTQFIVITHRRGTMEQADMLYGVTMQEKGISKLLMLDIAQVEKKFLN